MNKDDAVKYQTSLNKQRKKNKVPLENKELSELFVFGSTF